MVIVEVTHDLYFGKDVGNTGVQHIRIPAYLEGEKLAIGHNGLSEKHFKNSFAKYKASDFIFFCNLKYQRASGSNPHYLYFGIPFELMTLIDTNKKVLCTYLVHCREGTYLCRCNDCYENFVIDCYESPYYTARGLTIPTVRCKSCIAKRKKQKNR